jgi:hypothetical protein
MADIEQPRVEQLAEVVQQVLHDDKQRDEMYEKIDDAVDAVFEPDPAIKQLPWVKNRHYAMTDIADARNTGVRTFATLMPQIEITPLNDEQAEYERTDMAEQALSWEFERMNRNGKKSIHDAILEDAMSYHAVAFQTEYLPYRFKGMAKDARMRAMLRQRAFSWIRHHPKTVHARWSDDLLESVVKVANYSVQELIEKFGRDNPGIARLLQDRPTATPVELLKTHFTLIDWTDWQNRVIWAVPAGIANAQQKLPLAAQLSATSSQYVFMNEKHGLPFIPWVIVDKGNPLWEAVLKSGVWDNLQYMNLIRFAKSIELSTRSTLVIKTPDGTLRNVWVDFSNPSNPIVTALDGTIVENLNPAPIDPGLETMFQDASAKVASSTVSHVLRDITRFSNAPFATVNQMVTMALGQLSRAKGAAADAEAAGFLHMFEWIEHSGIPFNAYRPEGKDSKIDGLYRGAGEQITIRPGAAPTAEEVDNMSEAEYKQLMRTVYFDLEALYIKVELQANSATDEQARLNVNINAVDKLGMSREMAWERMGWHSYKLAQNQRIQETLLESELQNEVMRNNQEVIEQMRQEAMQQLQQQQAERARASEMNGGQQPTMEGVDNRTGGNPMAMANPGATREALSGQTATGGQVMQ